MSAKPEVSLLRPRFLTLVVLIAAAAAIVVANLSRDEPWFVAPPSPPPNVAYGWPLTWYWCQLKPSSRPPRTAASFSTADHVVVQWSGPRLSGNVAIWSVMFALFCGVCQCLLCRLRFPFHLRPRIMTLIAFAAVAVPVVLANLSCDIEASPQGSTTAPLIWQMRPSYGWPLIWRWRYIAGSGYGGFVELDENYSTARLIANLAMWLVMLGATAVACEWLLRRYRPRLRWSLRTMFTAVALVAALCAWCAALRDRAKAQDPVISAASDPARGCNLYFERWGPKWLDLVGADRFRRRVVGADVSYSIDDDDAFFHELARLPSLRYLKLSLEEPTRTLPAALAHMPNLRTLRIDDCDAISEECLAAVGELAQLEELHLEGMIDGGGLAHLVGLTKLKTLGLQIYWDADEDTSDEKGPEPPRKRPRAIPLLEHLPALPRLAAVDLRGDSTVGERDLRRLALLPRLTSLNLSDLHVTDAGLAELASLQSLEALAIRGDNASSAGLRALLALNRLKALHILRYTAVNEAMKAELVDQETLVKRAAEMLEEEMLEGRELSEEEDEMADDDTLDDADATSDDEAETADAAQPEHGPMSHVDWQLVGTLARLNRLRVERYGSYDKSDRLTTVALDHGDAVFALESEVEDFQRALDELRKANPGIVIDSDPKSFAPNRGERRRKNPYFWCGEP
jgi:hypothetical protein